MCQTRKDIIYTQHTYKDDDAAFVNWNLEEELYHYNNNRATVTTVL